MRKLVKHFKTRQLFGFFVALLLITGLAAGCSGGAKVKDGDTVKVDYTLKLEDGTVYDTSVGKEPLEFTLGKGELISGFEKAVIGMKVGESKTVKIPAAEAYGEYDKNLTATINRSELPSDIVPEIGLHLQAQNDDGSTTVVTIIAMTDTTITIDGNSPLAGKTLTFEIKLIEIVK